MQFSLGVLLTTTLMVCACAQKALNAQDFSVTGLDKYGLDDPSWSGMMPLDVRGEPHGQDGEFFFWLFESRSKDPDLPLIVWLNGGPGCSSTVGLVFENGPFKLKEGGEKGAKYVLEHNNYSWNEVGHTLYVEQPLRTGFSQPSKPKDPASKVVNELNVADDFYGFLLNFYRTFPRFQYVPLFLTGESYAGMYIPNIAQHIVERNVQKRSDDWDWDVSMKLQGVAIGNGAIDPLQDLSHAQYAYNHGLIPLGAKLAIESKVEMCTADGAVNVHEVARDSKNDVFESALDDAKKLSVVSECDTNMMVHVLLAAGQPNEYNTNTFVGYADLISPDGVYPRFLNDPEVQRALHILPDNAADKDAKNWAVCDDGIADDMVHDKPISAVPALQFLADHIRVLLYSGEADMNCNFLGTQNVLHTHMWRGQKWMDADRFLYRGAAPHTTEAAGEYFTLQERFSLLIVRNSGHLVPMDQPIVALDLIRRFVGAHSFADTPLPSEKHYYEQLYSQQQKHLHAEEEGLEGIARGDSSSSYAVNGAAVFLLVCLAGVAAFYKRINDAKATAMAASLEVPGGISALAVAQQQHVGGRYQEVPQEA